MAVDALLMRGVELSEVLTKLQATLSKRHHMRLYRSILADVATLEKKRALRNTVTVTVAREGDRALHDAVIQKAIETLGSSTYETKIDPTITGGYIAQGGEARIDASYKKRLLTLYRSIIKEV